MGTVVRLIPCAHPGRDATVGRAARRGVRQSALRGVVSAGAGRIVLALSLAHAPACQRAPDAASSAQPPASAGDAPESSREPTSLDTLRGGPAADLRDGSTPEDESGGGPPSSADGQDTAPAARPVPRLVVEIEKVGGDTARFRNAARVFDGARHGFRRCYFLALQENPNQSGKVRFAVTVDTDGAVSSVSATPAGTVGPHLTECMSTRIKNLQFDPPAGQSPARLTAVVRLTHAPRPSDSPSSSRSQDDSYSTGR